MLSETCSILKAMSDKNRLRIIKMLEVKPLCVCEITDILQLATSTVSKHLTILKDAGIVIDKKSGRWVTYELNHLSVKHVQLIVSVVIELLDYDKLIDADSKRVLKVNKDNICANNKR